MFGYIIVNRQELKLRELDVYQSWYCGLCRQLKEKYGVRGQLTLTYDMTFLILLLSGLYEAEEETAFVRCAAHPLGKHAARSSLFTGYAADMNVLLTYYQCMDDWKDEKKVLKKGYAPDHVVMVGDAPGDQAAAQKNGVWFYPILVRHEAESWAELAQTALPCLQTEGFAAYAADKAARFSDNLAR